MNNLWVRGVRKLIYHCFNLILLCNNENCMKFSEPNKDQRVTSVRNDDANLLHKSDPDFKKNHLQ